LPTRYFGLAAHPYGILYSFYLGECGDASKEFSPFPVVISSYQALAIWTCYPSPVVLCRRQILWEGLFRMSVVARNTPLRNCGSRWPSHSQSTNSQRAGHRAGAPGMCAHQEHWTLCFSQYSDDEPGPHNIQVFLCSWELSTV